MEVWRDIPDYEGFYQASTLGNIRSLDRPDARGYKIKGSLKKKSKTANGYEAVTFYARGAKKTLLVHRIIAMTFLPREEGKDIVNHINGVKDDNRLENLEWATYSENILHAYRTGLQPLGDKRKQTKIPDDQIEFIRQCVRDKIHTQRYLANKFGVDQSHISDIVRMKKRVKIQGGNI